MEMEHINENTIRVIIGKEDLQSRGVTFLDLMGNPDDIEGFFYNILEEVDEEERFQDTDTITFQVLPNRDGIELYITKNLNIDEGEIPSFNVPEDLKGEDYRDFIRQKILSMTQDKTALPIENPLEEDRFIFEFNDFEDLIQLAQGNHSLYGKTNVYVLNHRYYLELFYPNEEMTTYEKGLDVALVLEYSTDSQKTSGFLQEHGKLLMADDALNEIKKYF